MSFLPIYCIIKRLKTIESWVSKLIDLLKIEDPSFIKKLTIKELKELAYQIREFLIDNISKTGGHLSSNLGVVEITIAMYYVFDCEKDKFIFDVGHQSYVHKILTGRAKDFVTLRQYGGMSGYISRDESKYDVWESGHSSTSISAMTGMLLASEHKSEKIVSLIGDSSIMNGVALEGLNFLGSQKQLAPIIILNDNKMGISKSVGAISTIFSKMRGTKFWRGLKRVLNFIFPTFITNAFHQLKRGFKALIQQDNIFEDMGFDYYGPIKGNDLRACIKSLKRVKKNNQPVILHIITQKGKGYAPSEFDEEGSFHGVGPFDVKTGKPLECLPQNTYSFSRIVSEYLIKKRLVQQFFVVTPAMKAGAQLKKFAELYPNDFFDVGIAEEHAADMSAGMALSGKKVVLLYYSTFSQRAYDEILNDIARQNLSVIIGIDRAGVVGEDGPTHQGIYDIAMFSAMPHMCITMPKDAEELIGIFNYAFTHQGPIVIRYPRKNVIVDLKHFNLSYQVDCTWEAIRHGQKKCVISYGPDVLRLQKLIDDNNLNVGLVNARFIKPMDEKMLVEVFDNYDEIVVIEQVVTPGSLYDAILKFMNDIHVQRVIQSLSFNPDIPIKHGQIDEVLNHYGFSDEDILRLITK